MNTIPVPTDLVLCEGCGQFHARGTSVLRDGRSFCCDTCADGHPCIVPCPDCTEVSSLREAVAGIDQDIADGMIGADDARCVNYFRAREIVERDEAK